VKKLKNQVLSSQKKLVLKIKISNQNLQYRSDLGESETVFWLEAVKDLIIKNAFNNADLEKQS
jgi:hypothetical protein